MTQLATKPEAHDEHGHGHSPHLAHHFDTMTQQTDSGKLGMWVFLATEILMFGGLFTAYAVWRALHHEAFDIGHLFLNKWWGAFNTLLLIASSFTMAWAVRCAQINKKGATTFLLFLTFLGGLGFMCVKYVEYSGKFEHHMGPGKFYTAAEHRAADLAKKAAEHKVPGPAANMPAPAAPVGDRTALPGAAPAPQGFATPPAKTSGHGSAGHGEASAAGHDYDYLGMTPEQLVKARPFFSIYFVMTGLHGFHVLVGMGLIAWIMIRSHRGEFNSVYNAPVDLIGLYWHLVDLIWIFLFPLLYLIK